MNPSARLLSLALSVLTLTASTTLFAQEKPRESIDDPAQIKKAHDMVEEGLKKRNLSAKTLTDEQIVKAMQAGIEFLFKWQKVDNWESAETWAKDPKEGTMTGGETALVLLALLECGKSLDDPRLKFRSPELAPVVEYVTNLQSDRTYVLAMQTLALSELPPSPDQKYTQSINHAKDQLISILDQNAIYGYSTKKENNPPLPALMTLFKLPYRGKNLRFSWQWDNSNSQYALLGIWAAADAGVSVSSEYWNVQDAVWRYLQCKAGGWTYNVPINEPIRARDYTDPKSPGILYSATALQTRTMTAAGLASLYITQEFLDTAARLEPRTDPNIANGLKMFTEQLDPLLPNNYYLYGIERVGLASGYKYFDKTDWYREVAATLLASQTPEGSWRYGNGVAVSANVGTAYALLTLARGRNPILFNKLQYDGPWNARYRDTANFTHWASKTFERPLNWQIVNLQVPGDEWLDAPILMITGSKDPKFTPEQLAKLRAFVDGGGLIFSNADGGNDTFTAAIKKYATLLANNVYEMRLLPKDHPAYNVFYDIKNPPPLFGLSNGSRELWIHSTMDMGAAWQCKTFDNKLAFQIPSNIYFYASGKAKLRARLQPLTPTGGEEKHSLTVGRLQYAGNWDPEPGAWTRFARIAKADWSTGVTVQPVKAAELDPAKTPFVHLTGTARVTFAAEDVAAMKAFVEKGGVLLIDSAGGAPAFAQTAADLVKTLDLGNLQPLPADDPLFTGKVPDPIRDFEYRGPVIKQFKGQKPTGPLMNGVAVGKHWGILLSEQDVHSGLLGSHTWIAGYQPETALPMLHNIVMIATNTEFVVPATPATTEPAATEPTTKKSPPKKPVTKKPVIQPPTK